VKEERNQSYNIKPETKEGWKTMAFCDEKFKKFFLFYFLNFVIIKRRIKDCCWPQLRQRLSLTISSVNNKYVA
jgi:hypothetical protein